MENLWPKLEKVDLTTPKAILAQQAEYFNSLETGLQAVIASKQVVNEHEGYEEEEESFRFVHTLRIKANAMGGFMIPLLSADHKPTSLYPVRIWNYLSGKSAKATNEKELLDSLRTIFQSKEAVDAIQNMIVQSK